MLKIKKGWIEMDTTIRRNHEGGSVQPIRHRKRQSIEFLLLCFCPSITWPSALSRRKQSKSVNVNVKENRVHRVLLFVNKAKWKLNVHKSSASGILLHRHLDLWNPTGEWGRFKHWDRSVPVDSSGDRKSLRFVYQEKLPNLILKFCI